MIPHEVLLVEPQLPRDTAFPASAPEAQRTAQADDAPPPELLALQTAPLASPRARDPRDRTTDRAPVVQSTESVFRHE